MAHPFAKMFESALRKSLPDDMENRVLLEAEKLLEKGYRVTEIHDVLKRFATGIVDAKDESIAKEALLEFSRHLED